MSSGTSSGDEKKDAGKWAWASTENKWGKASATANKVTASATATPPSATASASATATVSLTASVDVGASLKVNASAQFSINVLTWNLTYLSMQTAGSVLTCRGAEVEANASKATVDGIINELTILKDVATALHKDTMDVELKNKLLINCISVLNLNS